MVDTYTFNAAAQRTALGLNTVTYLTADKPPNGAYDVEFDSGSAFPSGWEPINIPDATTTVAYNTTYPRALYMAITQDASALNRGYLNTNIDLSGVATWTVVSKMRKMNDNAAAAVGLMFADATSGSSKVFDLNIDYNGSAIKWSSTERTNFQNFVATRLNIAREYTFRDYYIALQKSGGVYTVFYSYDGIIWSAGNTISPSFTCKYYGPGFVNGNTATVTKGIVEYIRYYASTLPVMAQAETRYIE